MRKLTHFLSIPCTGQNFKQGFLAFKSQVLEAKEDETIRETLFQNPQKLHLTLGVMELTDDDKRKLAIETLDFCKKSVIGPRLPNGKLTVRMTGVDTFQKSPKKASVLYSKVINSGEDDQFVQSLAEDVRQCFVDQGLMSSSEKLTLHVTLMNSKFRLRKEKEWKKRSSRTFNAGEIVKSFISYNFGVDELSSIDISSFTEFGENGYYKPLYSISFSDRI